MTWTVREIESVAMRLPAHERARLAERLLTSLDEDAEVERLGRRGPETAGGLSERRAYHGVGSRGLCRGVVATAAVRPYAFLPPAQEELNQAAEFYESQAAGLGEDFLMEA